MSKKWKLIYALSKERKTKSKKQKEEEEKNTEQGRRPQYKLSFATNGCVHTFGFPGGSVVKNSPANAGDTGDSSLIPVSGSSPGGGHGNPLQCSCLEHPMDRGAWWAAVRGVAQSRARLSDWAWAQTFGETRSAQTSVCLSLKLGICVHNSFPVLRI